MESFLTPVTRLPPDLLAAMIAGILLLILGKRLFWLAVAGLGAFLAVTLALQFGPSLEPGVRLGVAVAAGLLGALFAVAAQKLALNAVGLLLGALGAGGLTFWIHAEYLGEDPGGWPFLAGIVGALFGLLFAQKLWNAALIVATSVVGSLLLVSGLSAAWSWTPSRESLVGLVLALVGVVIQSGRKKAPKFNE